MENFSHTTTGNMTAAQKNHQRNYQEDDTQKKHNVQLFLRETRTKTKRVDSKTARK